MRRQSIRKIEVSDMDLSCLLEEMADKIRDTEITYSDGTRAMSGGLCSATTENFETFKLERVTRYPGNDSYNEWVMTLYYRDYSETP